MNTECIFLFKWNFHPTFLVLEICSKFAFKYPCSIDLQIYNFQKYNYFWLFDLKQIFGNISISGNRLFNRKTSRLTYTEKIYHE